MEGKQSDGDDDSASGSPSSNDSGANVVETGIDVEPPEYLSRLTGEAWLNAVDELYGTMDDDECILALREMNDLAGRPTPDEEMNEEFSVESEDAITDPATRGVSGWNIQHVTNPARGTGVADWRGVSVPDAEEIQVESEEEEDPVQSQQSQKDKGHNNRGAFSALPGWKKVKKAVGSLSCRKGKSKSSGNTPHPGQDSLESRVHKRDQASMTHIHRRVMRKKRKNKRETDESGNSDYSPGPLPDEVSFLLRCALPS